MHSLLWIKLEKLGYHLVGSAAALGYSLLTEDL